jgi:hypothetical protein
MGVADVEAGDDAALEVAEYGPSGQRVIGVPAHRGSVPGRYRRLAKLARLRLTTRR